MDQRCNNCRYIDRPANAIPCIYCSNGGYNGKITFWQPMIEDNLDASDSSDHSYLMLELERLREELDKLIYIIKEKYKLEE